MNLITTSKNFIQDHSEFLPSVGLLAVSVCTEVATTNSRFSLVTGVASTVIGLHGIIDVTKKLWDKTQNQNESLFENTRLLAKGSLYALAFGFGLYQCANYDQLASKLFANNQLLESKVQTLEGKVQVLETNVTEQKETINKTNQLLTEKSDLADKLAEQITLLSKDKESLQNELSSINDTVKTKQDRLDTAHNELDTARNEKEAYKENLERLRLLTKSASEIINRTKPEKIPYFVQQALIELSNIKCIVNSDGELLNLPFGEYINCLADPYLI